MNFTPLESGVLACALDGMTARESAAAMGRSLSSIRKARERVCWKLDAPSVLEAAFRAWWL